MFNALVHLNWLAIVLATLAYYLLGAAWFALMFGKAWDRSIGYDRPRGHRFGIAYYIVPLVSALAVAIAVAIILTALAPENLGKGSLSGA